MRGILRTGLGRKVMSLWSYALGKKNYAIMGVAVIFLLYIFGVSLESIEGLIVISALFALSAFSTMYKRYFRAPPVFELMTISTIIVTVKYGILAGFIFGALSQIASEVLSGALDAQIIIFVPARAMLAVSTWVGLTAFQVQDVFVLGIIAIFSYNLMVQPISWIMGDMQLRAKTVYYTIGYTIINFFLFSILSGPANALLGW